MVVPIRMRVAHARTPDTSMRLAGSGGAVRSIRQPVGARIPCAKAVGWRHGSARTARSAAQPGGRRAAPGGSYAQREARKDAVVPRPCAHRPGGSSGASTLVCLCPRRETEEIEQLVPEVLTCGTGGPARTRCREQSTCHGRVVRIPCAREQLAAVPSRSGVSRPDAGWDPSSVAGSWCRAMRARAG